MRQISISHFANNRCFDLSLAYNIFVYMSMRIWFIHVFGTKHIKLLLKLINNS